MRPRKVEDIAGFLRREMQGGGYPSGGRLPAERELAVGLGVARSTLRAALGRLESEGYVCRRLGSKGGWFVTDLSLPLDAWWREMSRHREELRDMLDYRVAVECRVAELAAERCSAAQLDAMRATVSRMRQILAAQTDDRADRTVTADLHVLDGEFHNLMAAASGSRRLEEAVRLVRAELFAAEAHLVYAELPGDLPVDHALILEAIERRRPAAAADAMRHHIERGAEVWLRPALSLAART